MIIISFQKISNETRIKLNRFYSVIWFDWKKHNVKKNLKLFGKADIIFFQITIDFIHKLEKSRTFKYIKEIKEQLKLPSVSLIYDNIKFLSKINDILPYINNFLKKLPIFHCRNLIKLIEEKRENETDTGEETAPIDNEEKNKNEYITEEQFLNHYRHIVNENKKLKSFRKENQSILSKSLEELKNIVREQKKEIQELQEKNKELVGKLPKPTLKRCNAISQEELDEKHSDTKFGRPNSVRASDKKEEVKKQSFTLSSNSHSLFVMNNEDVIVEKHIFRSANEKRRKTKELKLKYRIP